MTTAPVWGTFDLGLVTIEFETALLVGAGSSDGLHDEVFVTDANGLPAIPATTLAGVLRHTLAGTGDPGSDPSCRSLFGFQDGAEGQVSAVRLSFGHLHDAGDLPVKARDAAQDAVTRFLQVGTIRDHVRIGGQGTVDDRGKFDERVVPAGARFTFEVCVDHASGKRFTDIVALLNQAQVRIGRRSRSGLGAFRLIRARSTTVDLTRPEGVALMAKIPVCLRELAEDKAGHLKDLLPAGRGTAPGWARCRLTLEPQGTWAIGGGSPTGREPLLGKDKQWDRLPLTEGRIIWKDGQAKVRADIREGRDAAFLVPGSSIKGALRHRTAFHARRLSGIWLKPELTDSSPTKAEAELFGEIRGQETGRPGRVFIADVVLHQESAPYVAHQHVSLDRFTQGPMDHLLFDELTLGPTKLVIEVLIRDPESLDETTRKALACALNDLSAGRLGLGVGRGHGKFRGKVEWLEGGSLSGGQA